MENEQTMQGDLRVIHRDVTATLDDFQRALRAAFPGSLEEHGNRFVARGAVAAIEVEFSPGPDRVIASLRLSTLVVVIRFIAGETDACAALLAHLDRYLHRGGG